MTGRIITDRNNVNFEEIYGIPIEFFSLVCYEISRGFLKRTEYRNALSDI